MTALKSFHRHIDVHAENLSDEIVVSGHLSDNVHEMDVRLQVQKPGLVIRKIEGRVIRGGTALCRLAEPDLERLTGLSLGKGFRKKALELLGGARGCTHLMSLILQINDNAIILSSLDEDFVMYEGPWEQRQPQALLAAGSNTPNACIAYAVDENVCKPQGEK